MWLEERKRKSSTYRTDGSIADDDLLCALVQLDWRGSDATNQGQGQECSAREHHFAERGRMKKEKKPWECV